MKKFSLSLGRVKEQRHETKIEIDTALARRVRGVAEQIFKEYAAGERTKMVLGFVARPLDDEFVRKALPDFTLSAIVPQIEQMATLASAEEYGDMFLEIFRPILELAHTYPTEFAEMRRKVFLAGGEFTKVNDVLSYDISSDDLHIHFAPAEDLHPRAALTLFEAGLRDLAVVVAKHPEVRVVSATSWMVTRLEDVLKSDRFQFTFQGQIDDDERKEHFPLETRRVSRATITREKFLEKYSG